MGKAGALEATLKRARAVLFDTAIPIYFLEGDPVFGDLARLAFAQLGRADFRAVLSFVSLAEILCKCFEEEGDERARVAADALTSIPRLEWSAVNGPTTIIAAQIRARFRLHLPDALILASGVTAHCDLFLTNDRRLTSAHIPAMKVVLLSDFA